MGCALRLGGWRCFSCCSGSVEVFDREGRLKGNGVGFVGRAGRWLLAGWMDSECYDG